MNHRKSDLWTGADCYDADDELHERATSFYASVNCDSVAAHCILLRDGVPCTLSDNYSIGHSNLVRQIVFQDGVTWVVRLRLPDLPTTLGNRETITGTEALEIEVASMKYLSSRTSIPVPTLRDWSLDCDNALGTPYIIMDYIDGLVATEMRSQKGCPPSMVGSPEQDERFQIQMASIQFEMASCRFSKIGSLTWDPQNDDFDIGRELVTGKGPWTSSKEYFQDAASDAFEKCLTDPEHELHMSRSLTLPLCLTNRDFGAHNLLVNDDFQIVAMIDFDGIMAAPVELAAQFPSLTGLQREAPGYVPTNRFAIERVGMAKPKLTHYRDLLIELEAQAMTAARDSVADSEETEALASAGFPSAPITPLSMGGRLFSDIASIVQGLGAYASRQEHVNDLYMDLYLKLLKEKGLHKRQ
ncbi:Uu.00g001060.m01.CDS01 [Anthostomella pinea]|uniref:Uu.00g001060.m01.CDS01 n=1 Tax=Anthostomella pinea TaxID=933095 RepID=A0AAI8VJX6_9PEZI|nr:Uu.00g001060.m01.CDS01 [Anthostomella pinea]